MLSRCAAVSRRLPPSRWRVRAGRAITAAVGRFGRDPVSPVTMADGTTILLDPRSRTEAGPFWEGVYEPAYQAVLRSLCDTYGPRVHDVGANVGLVTIPLAHHLRARAGAAVVAFEPVQANFARLVASLSLNDAGRIVTPLPVALGDRESTIAMRREAAHGATSGNAVLRSDASAAGAAGLRGPHETLAARMTTLDQLMDEGGLAEPDVMKVDVEGSEVLFLRGAMATITRMRPVIIGEFNSGYMPLFGHTFLDAAALLTPLGYRTFSFLTADRVVEREPCVGLGDVLLVPTEKVDDLPVHHA